jgi:hypothetical protein
MAADAVVHDGVWSPKDFGGIEVGPRAEGVDGRVKPGHDGVDGMRGRGGVARFPA